MRGETLTLPGGGALNVRHAQKNDAEPHYRLVRERRDAPSSGHIPAFLSPTLLRTGMYSNSGTTKLVLMPDGAVQLRHHEDGPYDLIRAIEEGREEEGVRPRRTGGLRSAAQVIEDMRNASEPPDWSRVDEARWWLAGEWWATFAPVSAEAVDLGLRFQAHLLGLAARERRRTDE